MTMDMAEGLSTKVSGWATAILCGIAIAGGAAGYGANSNRLDTLEKWKDIHEKDITDKQKARQQKDQDTAVHFREVDDHYAEILRSLAALQVSVDTMVKADLAAQQSQQPHR